MKKQEAIELIMTLGYNRTEAVNLLKRDPVEIFQLETNNIEI